MILKPLPPWALDLASQAHKPKPHGAEPSKDKSSKDGRGYVHAPCTGIFPTWPFLNPTAMPAVGPFHLPPAFKSSNLPKVAQGAAPEPKLGIPKAGTLEVGLDPESEMRSRPEGGPTGSVLPTEFDPHYSKGFTTHKSLRPLETQIWLRVTSDKVWVCWAHWLPFS